MKLGLAFQIQDDYLDMFGGSGHIRETYWRGRAQRQKGFMLVSMLERGGSDADALREAMKMPPSELKVNTVRSIYEHAGMPELCSRTIGEYSRKSLKALRSTSLGEEARMPLERLVDKLIDRKK